MLLKLEHFKLVFLKNWLICKKESFNGISELSKMPDNLVKCGSAAECFVKRICYKSALFHRGRVKADEKCIDSIARSKSPHSLELRHELFKVVI